MLIGCVSCIQSKKNVGEGDDDTLFHIKIEKPNFSSLKPLRLSEFVDSIAYVQLETSSKCLIPYYGTPAMSRVDDLLFMSDYLSIFKFNVITGEYLCQIGRRGPGPKEYIQAHIAIDKENSRVIVKSPDRQNLLVYNYEGNHIHDMSLDDTNDSLFTDCFYSLALGKIDKKNMVFIADFMPAEQACHPHELVIFDYENKKIVCTLPNRMEGTYNLFSVNIVGARFAIKQDDKLFYKSFYNDTLYVVHEANINPYAVVDLGTRKYPTEAIFSRNNNIISGKILISNAYIHHKCILLECLLLNDDK